MMRVLGIIPARGGSKGIPRKNIVPLFGKPLLAYTADAALAAKSLSCVVLSTDDEEIADLGRQLGLDVPFIRPRELANDETPTLPVAQHAVNALESKGECFDAICLLQPTCPLRRAEDIDACIRLLSQRQADCVMSVMAVPAKHNPHWVYFQSPDGTLHLSTGEAQPIARRQDLPAAWHRDGSVYVTRRECLMQDNSLYGNKVVGYSMDPAYSMNIDTPEDLLRAEQWLASPGLPKAACQ